MTSELERLSGAARRLFHFASGTVNRRSLARPSESRLR
jgi:hypothetical protein